VSVLIRTTVSTVLDNEMQKSFLSIWERDVVAELEKARRDGWTWKRKYVQNNAGSTTDKMVGDEQNVESDGNVESDNMEEDDDGDDDDDNGEDAKPPADSNGQGANRVDTAIPDDSMQGGLVNLDSLVYPESAQMQGVDSGDESTSNILMVSV
jgi:hypothetical protein